MAAVRAERLCPNAVFLPPDLPRYRAVSRQVREIFKCHTDLIERLSLDEAHVAVSENKTGLPTATQVARTIREQIRAELSLTASAGVASRNSKIGLCRRPMQGKYPEKSFLRSSARCLGAGWNDAARKIPECVVNRSW